jgi:GntR family transcriptional regulator/MocR family aminotransferase
MRGTRCSAEQVVITSGVIGGLDLIARLMVDRGDHVFMEDPNYDSFACQIQERGADLVPLTVDENGAAPPLDSEGPQPRIALVSGECQPIWGVRMSAERRQGFIQWALRRDAYLVENDADWPFMFEGVNLRSLQGWPGGSQCVLNLGSFMQTIGPTVRAGYAIVPEPLRSLFTDIGGRVNFTPPVFVQLAIARFIEGGHYSAHLRRTRAVYEQRRQILTDACRRHLGFCTLIAGQGGVNIALYLPDDLNDVTIADAAARQNISASPMSRMCWSARPRQGLLLGYCSVPNAQIEPAVIRLAKIIDNVRRGAA